MKKIENLPILLLIFLIFGTIIGGCISGLLNSRSYGWQDYTFDSNNSITVKGATGYVGINNSSPSQRLDVMGTIKSTYFIGDGSQITNIPSSALIGLATVSTTGSYTDLINKPTRSFNYTTPALNTVVQLSTTNDVEVFYAVNVTFSSPLIAGTSGTVFLDIADNSGMTTNLHSISCGTNSTSGVLNLTNIGPDICMGVVPSGKYRQIRTVNNTGTPTFSAQLGEEVTLP